MKPGNQHDSFACPVPIPAGICLRDKDAIIVVLQRLLPYGCGFFFT